MGSSDCGRDVAFRAPKGRHEHSNDDHYECSVCCCSAKRPPAETICVKAADGVALVVEYAVAPLGEGINNRIVGSVFAAVDAHLAQRLRVAEETLRNTHMRIARLVPEQRQSMRGAGDDAEREQHRRSREPDRAVDIEHPKGRHHVGQRAESAACFLQPLRTRDCIRAYACRHLGDQRSKEGKERHHQNDH